MHASSDHISLWYILMTLAGVVAAVVVYILTTDVVWTVIALVMTVAVARRLVGHDAASH
jgi:branched-subunit amino acid transport protein